MFYCRNCKSQVMAGQSVCPSCGCDVIDNYETVCPTCQTHNRGGSRFCASCGGILPLIKRPVCVICGALNVPGAKFCCSCGGPMLMAEETHSIEDIIEQRKQKMRADLIAKDKLQQVDEEISRRRVRIAQEESKARDIITEREQEYNEYINYKAEQLLAYKAKLEEADSLDVAKLKKLAKAVRTYSAFLASPFSELSDADKRKVIFVCPVCGAENSLKSKVCYACGRSKQRSIELHKKGKIVRHPNFSMMNHKTVKAHEKIDIADVKRMKFEDMPNDFAQKFKNANASANNNNYANGFQTPQYAQNGQMMNPNFAGANNPVEPYQMPPIVQPVAFVPYVTQDQPLLQIAADDKHNKG